MQEDKAVLPAARFGLLGPQLACSNTARASHCRTAPELLASDRLSPRLTPHRLNQVENVAANPVRSNADLVGGYAACSEPVQ